MLVILALTTAALFGLALVLGQFGLRRIEPLAGACISLPTATIILCLLFAAQTGMTGWPPAESMRAGLPYFALSGLLFPAIVTLLTFLANRQIGPVLTASFGNLSPIFAVALAAVLLGEWPLPLQWTGIAIILCGVFILLYAPRGSRASSLRLAAVGFAVLAACIRGFMQPVSKLGLVAWPDPLAAAAIGYVCSSGTMYAIYLVMQRRLPRILRPGALWFVGIGLCNGAAMLCLFLALSLGEVIIVAPLVATYPVFTLLIGRLLRSQDRLPARGLAGVALTVLGVICLLVTLR